MSDYWDVDWDNAKCKTDPTVTADFYPEPGPRFHQRVQAAKLVCKACPIQLQCLEYGLIEDFGIWGGLTPDERRGKRPVQVITKSEGSMNALKESNRAKSLAAAAAIIPQLKEAIELASTAQVKSLTAQALPLWIEAANLRINNPTMSNAEIAKMMGVTGSVFASRITRLKQLHEELTK